MLKLLVEWMSESQKKAGNLRVRSIIDWETVVTVVSLAVRKAVGNSGEEQRLIRTIARKGFRFVGEVSKEQVSGHGAPSMPVLALPDKPSIVAESGPRGRRRSKYQPFRTDFDLSQAGRRRTEYFFMSGWLG